MTKVNYVFKALNYLTLNVVHYQRIAQVVRTVTKTNLYLKAVTLSVLLTFLCEVMKGPLNAKN